jgi:hypothetical protein
MLLDKKGFCKKWFVLKAYFKNKKDKDKPTKGSECPLKS